MSIENNVFYQNRMKIKTLCEENGVDAGVGTDMLRASGEIKYTTVELQEWKEEMVKYMRHKTLTLADLFK